MRILDLRYSGHFILIERSESIICHLSLFISHLPKFHTSAASG
ncbi:hypothetical protein D1AOALGA4SA_10560 [Olavius algarvensis Delta 1 endosymbiont]|nr:hypothetical protein D1AOALGA4SA_10560 [Olavius algarvensis Delta 1 endosymbiont]